MAKNPWKLLSDPFKSWTRKDFFGKRDESGWEKALKKGRKISISTPQSNRYWVVGDDSKYYTSDELADGDTVNITSNPFTGEATGDVDTARVDSTAVELIEYDPQSKILRVVFKGGNGKGYDYPNVPVDVVKAFMNAPSKGKYLANVIAPKYSVAYSK